MIVAKVDSRRTRFPDPRKDGELNKVVARMADGSLIKGTTADFVAHKDTFHIQEASAPVGSKPLEIHMKDLKGLFFVKDYTGDKQRAKRNEFDPKAPSAGRRIQVVFKDGEILLGTTTGYQPGRPGFFVVPADSASNMERCYVVTAATKEVKFL